MTMAHGVAQSHSVAETQELAASLAAALAPGDLVCLYGELGAGKTYFTKGLVAGLGGDAAAVSSPTFVLMQTYQGHLPVYHFDSYRLRGGADMLELGSDEIIFGDGVTVIEWADRVAEVLPKWRFEVRILTTGPEDRRLEITGLGASQAARVRHLVAQGVLATETL